jgi:hypothetical protein
MILGTVITLGGLAYTVVYSVFYYNSSLQKVGQWPYLLALVLYNAGVITVLALRHPCYSFLDVGICALVVNLLFVFYRSDNTQILEFVLRNTLFLAFLALLSNLANCLDGCCR